MIDIDQIDIVYFADESQARELGYDAGDVDRYHVQCGGLYDDDFSTLDAATAHAAGLAG